MVLQLLIVKGSLILELERQTHLFCTRLESSPVLLLLLPPCSSLRCCPPVSSCNMLDRSAPLLLLPLLLLLPAPAAAWLLLVMPETAPASPLLLLDGCCLVSSLNHEPLLRAPEWDKGVEDGSGRERKTRTGQARPKGKADAQ